MISPTIPETYLQFAVEPMAAAFEAFRQAYPAFDSTWKLDNLRATEYARLDREGHVYLDYTGGGLYADMPPRQSFVVEMVEGKEDLTSAIGLNSAIHNLARTLGPAIAGLVVATRGEAVAFFINSLSFIAVIICLLLMRNLPKTVHPQGENPPIIAHMLEGVRYVLGQQVLLVLMSLVAVTSFLSRPYQTLLPVFADDMLQGSAQPVVSFFCYGEYHPLNCLAPEAPLGLMFSAVGIGAVSGAILVASLPAATATRARQHGRMAR